jgi:hypothetical protein
MEEVHAEYPIPPINLPVDLLDSITGEMWEIKPWDDYAQAVADIQARVVAMEAARTAELLTGMSPVALRYDWNFSPPFWSEGLSFPSEVYIGTDSSGWFDIYAGQVEPGVLLWWKYARLNPRYVPVPINLPDNVTWSQRNKRPNWHPQPGLSPAPAFDLFPNTGFEPLPLPGSGNLCPPLYPSFSIDSATSAVVVWVGVSAGTLWWLGKLLSPACGPLAPICPIAF